jgi:hypothetical protein
MNPSLNHFFIKILSFLFVVHIKVDFWILTYFYHVLPHLYLSLFNFHHFLMENVERVLKAKRVREREY